MKKLPKRFPEYSIMHKTLSKKIRELKDEKTRVETAKRAEIESKINRYQVEKEKIEKMFPEKFFEI